MKLCAFGMYLVKHDQQRQVPLGLFLDFAFVFNMCSLIVYFVFQESVSVLNLFTRIR